MRYGLIAGNGKFPLMVVEGAKRRGASLSVAAIREEAEPEIERIAERVEWVSIGQLGKMIRFFKSEGVEQAVMAGQVKHIQIFSRTVPDARMLKLLMKLPRRNTGSLIGAVADELSSEGIELIDSTCFLQEYLPQCGTLTRREPDAHERGDVDYGLEITRELARLDLGQTIVVRAKACVAIEAMEGTDSTIRRAGALTGGESNENAAENPGENRISDEQRSVSQHTNKGAGVLRGFSSFMRGKRVNLSSGRLTVVKVAKHDQDMRFDVPVVGLSTIEAMIAAGATCLCISAGKTLMFDFEEMLALANQNNIAIVAV